MLFTLENARSNQLIAQIFPFYDKKERVTVLKRWRTYDSLKKSMR